MSHKIVVYSTPTCPYCHMAKDFLTKKGFTFENKNVALDEAAANDLVEKSGQMGVPVIEIDDQIVIGFDQVALEDLLK